MGVCGYPFFSKVWNSKLCHWTAAEVVFELPIIGRLIKSFGHIPAKSKPIITAITGDQPDNVGLVLDGIPGMFNGGNPNIQKVHLKERTTVVGLAMEAGATIVPLYGFGQASLWTVLQDPWGILEGLSIKLQTSIVPFVGRGWMPMGPPTRDVPVTVVLGEPVHCPKLSRPAKGAATEDQDKYQAVVEEYHGKMLASFKEAFDTHKAAYGVPKKEMVIV